MRGEHGVQVEEAEVVGQLGPVAIRQALSAGEEAVVEGGVHPQTLTPGPSPRAGEGRKEEVGCQEEEQGFQEDAAVGDWGHGVSLRRA